MPTCAPTRRCNHRKDKLGLFCRSSRHTHFQMSTYPLKMLQGIPTAHHVATAHHVLAD
jgi:hypothetical protein